jgi:hypothetical protein
MKLKSEHFKGLLFLSGIILIIIGSILYLHGPKRFLDYESEDIGSWNQRINGFDQKEIVWYKPGNFSRYCENLTCYAKFHTGSVSEAEVTLIVLNDSQLELWEEQHVLRDSLIHENMSNNEEIEISLLEQTTHHFILENRLNVTIDATFSLSWSGFFLRFDYDGSAYYILMIVAGTILCLSFRGTILRSLDNTALKLATNHGQKKTKNWSEDEKALKSEYYKNAKFLVKLLAFAFAAMLLLFFLFEFVKAYQVNNEVGKFFRPEFSWVIYDYAIRLTLYAAFLIIPLFTVFALSMLIIDPLVLRVIKEEVLLKVGIKHQTEKQFLIERASYKKIISKVKSLPVLFVLILPALLLMIFSFLLSSTLYAYSFVACMSLMGTTAGLIASVSFHEACEELRIGEYAAQRSLKVEAISFTISTIVITGFIVFTVSTLTSNSWISLLNEALFSSVSLLGARISIPLFDPQLLNYVVLGIIAPMILLAVLPFVLFPAIYKKGRKRITVALITFTLTYLTEIMFSMLFRMTATFLQPLAVVSPMVVSAFSWILQGKYQQKIKRIVKPKAI